MSTTSDEMQAIRSYIRTKTSERMKDFGLSYADLAKVMQTPKSTLSGIFGNEGTRLPNIYTLLKLARALDIPVSALLPPHLFGGTIELSSDGRGSTHVHQELSLVEVTQSILKYGMNDEIYYHPRSIPEFIKPISLLSEETGISQENIEAYHSVLQSTFHRRFQGKVVIDEHAMVDLLDRSGIFANISRRDSLNSIDQLREFCDLNMDGVSVHVGSRHKDRLDPVLILGSSIAISDYFQTLIYIENPSIIQVARNKIVLSCETNPTLSEWLDTC